MTIIGLLFLTVCASFYQAVSKSEHHFCQIPESVSDCSAIVCTSKLVMDELVLILNMAIQIDGCARTVHVTFIDFNVSVIVTEPVSGGNKSGEYKTYMLYLFTHIYLHIYTYIFIYIHISRRVLDLRELSLSLNIYGKSLS